jgi:hypothetical protein
MWKELGACTLYRRVKIVVWAEEHPRSYMVQDKLVQNLVAVLFCGLKMLGLETIEAYVMWHLFTEFGGN